MVIVGRPTVEIVCRGPGIDGVPKVLSRALNLVIFTTNWFMHTKAHFDWPVFILPQKLKQLYIGGVSRHARGIPAPRVLRRTLLKRVRLQSVSSHPLWQTHLNLCD